MVQCGSPAQVRGLAPARCGCIATLAGTLTAISAGLKQPAKGSAKTIAARRDIPGTATSDAQTAARPQRIGGQHAP